MGGEIEESPTPQKLVDYLNELFAYALAIGMDYQTYWIDDPLLINAYVRADQIKQRRKDHELWLQGLYVYHAIGNLAPVLNALAKSHKPGKYPEFPFSTPQEEIEQAKAERFKQQLREYARAFNQKIKEKENG